MIKYDSFIIIMNIGEPVTIRVRATGDEVLVPTESSCLIPAAIADYDIILLTTQRRLWKHSLTIRSL